MKEAMERYGVSPGSLNSALTYGYSAGGYHFYRADEPKPDDSFFKSGNGGKGSSKKRPVICLETGVQFESAIAALKWLDSGKTNNRGNMRTALISGSALLCWNSVNHLPAIRRISLKANLTSRLIDFKYLREADPPAYTHGVSNDAFDYEFDDDDIPVFSAPEDL